ncbi:carbon-nitrogen hydrolase family protein [Parvularcula marina]|uniref:Carbon-nitrogen hydrolase family protein n=1 Tax=Parvularcula marina TaxID=2292771 RepID=A0A371RIH8_9PROT|nr:carbon-nitrogen hydrolase family protein [Parvularcula marina]RFB05238.1 carbon-nitrogen hydrolase family protein [Parvularcula marina]
MALEIIRPSDQGTIREKGRLTVALAQIAPVWLDRDATLEKVAACAGQAASEGAQLVCFGESLVPGYPFWVERTDGAQFESDVQKEWYAHYLDHGVEIESGHLEPLCAMARDAKMAVYLGVMERAADRGGHTLYASLVYIGEDGEIKSVHRKLMPTYEERLVWGAGDGNGLRVHKLGAFTAGGLNCWENWLPLARASLYAQGEDLHVAVWPGGLHNTEQLTPMIAREGRGYALSVSGLMSGADVPQLNLPDIGKLNDAGQLANGASCIADPDGNWVIPPVLDKEALLVADLDHAHVRRAHLTLDVVGHYSRPDVFDLHVNRRRQSTVTFKE